MTDPTPQAEQEWFCISCNHPHVMHQNVSNGQSCHCGGCTAWVPELRPAERVIEVAPQEETLPEHQARVSHDSSLGGHMCSCGYGYPGISYEMWRRHYERELEAALTTARKEIDRLKEVVK